MKWKCKRIHWKIARDSKTQDTSADIFCVYFSLMKLSAALFNLYKPLTPLSHLILSSVASVVAFSLWSKLGKVQSHLSAGVSRRKTILCKFPLSNMWDLFPASPGLPKEAPQWAPMAPGEPFLAVVLLSSRLQTFPVCSCLSQLGYPLWAKALSSPTLPWSVLASLVPFVECNIFNAEISGVFFFLLLSPFSFVSFLTVSYEPAEMFCTYKFPVWLALT